MISCGAVNEYGKLEAVLLAHPPAGISDPDDPKDVLHPERVDYEALAFEFDSLKEGLKDLGINVHMIDTTPIEGMTPESFYNLMYVRDLFSLVGERCFLARMQKSVRKEETIYAKNTLKALGLNVVDNMPDDATFEGADMLWVSRDKAVVGVGRRTNDLGYELVSREVKIAGCETIKVEAPSESLHLLGSVQIVDKNLAFVRGTSIGDDLREVLDENHICMIEVEETEEVLKKYAMNFVTVAPRKVIIPSGVPEMKEIFASFGVEVVKEFKTSELIKGGGALGCAIGILKRET